jgi:hypothetical protein
VEADAWNTIDIAEARVVLDERAPMRERETPSARIIGGHRPRSVHAAW